MTSVHSLFDVRIFLKECRSLAKLGFDVSLIAFGDEYSDRIEQGVRCIVLHLPTASRLQRAILRSRVIYRKALELNVDIYHFHDPELIFIGLLLKRKGKKVIYDAHEDLPRQLLQKSWIPKIFRKPFSVIIEFLEDIAARRFDGVVTVSNHIGARFSRVNNSVVVCHNYASIEEFGKIEAWGIDIRRSVCYVGAISVDRGILQLIEAAERLRDQDITFQIGGRSSNQGIIKRLEVENIEYHGFVDRVKAREIFSESFAGIVAFLPAPNHNNANPNKLFEYMAAGLPIISSNFEAWRDIVEGHNIGIVVDPNNVEEIVSAILYLKNNMNIAKDFGRNSRRVFEEKFNWQTEEKKLLQLYLSM